MKRISIEVHRNQDCSNAHATAVGIDSGVSLGSSTSPGYLSALERNRVAKRRSLSNRKVQFSNNGVQVYDVDCYKDLPYEIRASIWYSSQVMGNMRKSQIQELKAAQAVADAEGRSSKSFNPALSWRGYEDVVGNWSRSQKANHYISHVLEHFHCQLANKCADADELGCVARALSKEERQRARDLGIADAKKVGQSANRRNKQKPSNKSNDSASLRGLRSRNSFSNSITSLISMVKKTALGDGNSTSQVTKNATWPANTSRNSKIIVSSS